MCQLAPLEIRGNSVHDGNGKLVLQFGPADGAIADAEHLLFMTILCECVNTMHCISHTINGMSLSIVMGKALGGMTDERRQLITNMTMALILEDVMGSENAATFDSISVGMKA